jgi:heme/copper-type cytochrome/quinol oxidase subunit 2
VSVILGALLLAVSIVPAARADEPPTDTPSEEGMGAAPADTPERPVKEIKLYVEKWKWTPDVIRVKQGTLLKIEALSHDASRRFDLKAYRLKVPLPEGKRVDFEFVADKAGKFHWKCGRPCGNGCAKLWGTLIVEE